VESDFVIITIPFTLLREIPFHIEISPIKRKAIAEMGYGKNAKLFMGFTQPFWRDLGYTGFSFSDNGLQNGWDNSQLQNGEGAGYTIFTGGALSDTLLNGADKDLAALYLEKMGPFFKSAKQFYNQKTSKFHWPTYRYSKASYTCYKPGQFTTIEGAQKEPEGNIYFAGEHCSYEFQGFMNGAAQTGRIAAEKIINLLD